MSALKQRINEDVKEAMRARDRVRLGTLRMILAAIKQKEVDERIELDDTRILAVLDRMARQHRESIEQFEKAGRSDLVQKEQSELQVVSNYLPQAAPEEEVDRIIGEIIAEVGASSAKDMGRVMAALKPRLQGRADMARVSAQVKQRLGQ